jgi:hypothetical protein
MTTDYLIECVRRVARENGGQPPGESRFYRETKLTKNNLWDASIRSYGDLCELAGLPRNQLTQRLTPNQLFEPLAVLTLKLKRFPDVTDRKIARRADSTFPGYDAYRTAQDAKGSLDHQLLEWCKSRPEYSVAAEIVQTQISQQNGRPQKIKQGSKQINGYVYLMRYGNSGHI